jgi:hypothetical protein
LKMAELENSAQMLGRCWVLRWISTIASQSFVHAHWCRYGI